MHLLVTGGAYSGTISLTPGRWVLTVTADEVPGSLAATSQAVTVDITPATGVVLEIRTTDKAAWIAVYVDGRAVEPGVILKRRQSMIFTGKDVITVLTGNAGMTEFVLNGKNYGALGFDGEVGTWRFENGKRPLRV